MTVMRFDNVSKVFYTADSETVAVDDLSFEVHKGEFVAAFLPY